jgi:hypothetical protein
LGFVEDSGGVLTLVGWFVTGKRLIFCPAARPGMGLTQLSIQWAPVISSSGINGPEGEVEYLAPFIFEIRNIWNFTSTSTRAFVVNKGFSLPLKLI